MESVDDAPHPRAYGSLARYGLGEELTRALFHGLPLGLCIVDHTGKIIMVNPLTEQLLERPAHEMIGADAHDLLHRNPDGSPIPPEDCPHIAALRSNTSVFTDEAWYTLGGGGLIPVGLMVAPVQLGEGAEPGAVLLAYDLRQHKAVEQEQAAHLVVLEGLTDRLSLMAEISTVLASALEVEEALRRLSRLVVPCLADWAVIDLLEPDGTLRRVSIMSRSGECPAGAGWEQTLTETAWPPLARVLRGDPPVLLGARELAGVVEAGVTSQKVHEMIGATSVIVAPLRTPRRVLGALSLIRSGSSPAYDAADLSLVSDIAERAGLAVDTADMFEEQRRIAETMQRHLITPLPRVERLELAARYQPAPRGSQVGGDWYDAFPLPCGANVLVIGDVMGHDLQAAAKMSQIRNMLRMAAWARRVPPSHVVDQLDDALPHITDDLMATLVLALVEEREDGSWWLHWTSAGHPPPLLVDADGSARYLEQGQGLLLGTGVRTERPDAGVLIPAGGTLLLYTDGLIETVQDPLEMGMDRLRRHATALSGSPLPSFCDEILARMRHDVIDDIALLALRPSSPAGNRG
ncbi:DNA-binding protein [Actinomadura craniellae]|uniref:protein-serine/threonine phosphatase n=1 Tax=Actinomadura craniellae TaxID=2231787 RepID=A0A365HD59_9ACTN|nr:SpoIIE family protein phosphatase [Actinomadura craniellae]RAY16948.1 DNA-binding protein [Actinomadura craniellae]